MWRGMFFIKTGGVLFLRLRGKRGMFFLRAGFTRDIGWVFQLLETYLAKICNSTVIEMYEDMIRISDSFEGCQ